MRVISMDCAMVPLSFGFGFRVNTPSPAPVHRTPVLTPREIDLLTMFSRGLSYKESAAAMRISVNTINDHVKAVYRKLGVNSRSEAVFEAVQLGLVTL